MQTKNGVVDVAVRDEAEAVAVTTRLLAFFQGDIEPVDPPDQAELAVIIPERRRRAYEVGPLIETLADAKSTVFLRKTCAPEMVTARRSNMYTLIVDANSLSLALIMLGRRGGLVVRVPVSKACFNELLLLLETMGEYLKLGLDFVVVLLVCLFELYVCTIRQFHRIKCLHQLFLILL